MYIYIYIYDIKRIKWRHISETIAAAGGRRTRRILEVGEDTSLFTYARPVDTRWCGWWVLKLCCIIMSHMKEVDNFGEWLDKHPP